MKDVKNKKVIIAVVLAVLALLVCLFAFRSCDKEEQIEENEEILEPVVDDNDDQVEEELSYVEEYEASIPTIRLNGSEKVYVEINSAYKEEGAKAQDNRYGDLTSDIIISGNVDITKLGSYVITYTITNKDSKTVSVTREVIVQDTTSPTIKYREDVSEGSIVPVDANKSMEFTDHQVTADDNSGSASLEMLVYYRDFSSNEYVRVESMDISKLGYYKVYYTAVDESGNRSDDTLVVEYLVEDNLGPEITVSNDGTEYPQVNPTAVVKAEDANTNVSSFAYAWVADLLDTPSWTEVASGDTLTPPANGTYYLMLKAVDELGNESELTTKAFEKDDTLMNVTNFNLYSGTDYTGVSAGIKVNKLADITDISSIVIKLYSGDTLLATNTNTDKIYELALSSGSIEFSTPFIVKEGTYVEEYWTTETSNDYTVSTLPTKVVFEVTKANGEVHTLENNVLLEPDGNKWEKFFYTYDILVGSTRGDYQTVQDAVDNASNGAKILVLEGTYDGAIVIDKDLTIFGTNKETTILTNTVSTDAVITIDTASNVIIQNITINGNGTVAGGDINSSKVTIDNNIITNVKNALYVSGTSDVTVNNSHISDVEGVDGYGYIDAEDTSKLTITNTTIVGNEENDSDIGVYFYGDSTGSVVDSDLSNLGSAVGYQNNQPATSGNTYTNCTNDVVQIN